MDRRASIGDAEEEIWWVSKDLTGKGVDVDVDLDTVLDENFGMMGHLVKAHRYPARLVHSYAGMRADAWAGDRSHEVVGMCIKTKMIRGAHMAQMIQKLMSERSRSKISKSHDPQFNQRSG